jgi:hypothetical protein
MGEMNKEGHRAPSPLWTPSQHFDEFTNPEVPDCEKHFPMHHKRLLYNNMTSHGYGVFQVMARFPMGSQDTRGCRSSITITMLKMQTFLCES